MREAAEVARACGVAIPEDLVEQILKIPAAMPNQTSSTAQDLARGKPSEIDFLNGHVVRKGAELGIAVADQSGPAGDGETGGARQGDIGSTGIAARHCHRGRRKPAI